MGLLCDYFAASSDEEAAATIDWIGGPSRPPENAGGPYRVISLGGVEPTVMMGQLEALLTGRSLMDEIIGDPTRRPIAERDGGERLVVSPRPANGWGARKCVRRSPQGACRAVVYD